MPPITRIIRPRSTDAPAETIRTLHTELAAVGLPVSGTEASGTPRFEAATEARVREFQVRHRLPDTGNLDPVTGGVMTLSALVATEQDRGRLRTALREAEGRVASAPIYNYWLARYAIMTRDYALARRVRPHLGDVAIDPDGLVFEIPDPPPQQPEVAFPENFYTYRYNLMSQEDITNLRTGRTQFSARVPYFMARRFGSEDPDFPEPPVLELPPSPTSPPAEDQEKRLADSAEAWLAAIEAWQQGNADSTRQRYSGAVASYTRCQEAALQYFAIYPGYNLAVSGDTLDAKIDELVRQIASDRTRWAGIWEQINWRHQLLSLQELRTLDWTQIGPYSSVYLLLKANLAGKPQVEPPTHPLGPEHRTRLMDARLLVIASVLAPLARGEANRLRRQYLTARQDFERVLRDTVPVPNSNPPAEVPAHLKCEFIEPPFARLLLAETLFDQAESQYKSRLRVDDQTDEAQRTRDLTKLNKIAQDFRVRNIPGHSRNTTLPLQHLVAAVTYAKIFEVLNEDGAYVERTKEALNGLHTSIASTIANAQTGSLAFRSMGQALTVSTISSIGDSLPKLIESKHPHQPYLKIQGPGGEAISEANPQVYAILLQTQARLLQIWSGFNYLGYLDDHVPTWRFMFLLERARYFTEHAKNAQREYLNFLSNAEREEFQELTVSQNVEMEKSNIRIETARVDQVRLEVAASTESKTLADIVAQNASDRLTTYETFSRNIEGVVDREASLAGSGMADLLDSIHPFLSSVIENVPFVGGFFSSSKRKYLEAAQRAVERHNLQLATQEAHQAANVAAAHLATAQAALIVAALQRQAALLRHEFAIQNLSFLRNRTLNAELWYRLSGAIRSVADTYLRYGIEMAFLAEQAYEFEADKRMDVIRFDYDVSDLGDMLAGDFLLRDLDTLEQDLIVSQRIRQQQVRYVLSLAREFPEALQELRDNGHMTFSLRLEQLERRFPGLFNLRISSVEVLPFALMDATRFSLELTHLGSGQVRMKPPPPSLGYSPNSLSFNGVVGSSGPASKEISIANTGGGTLLWTANGNAPWLTMSPQSGTNNGTITVSVDSSTLTAGTYEALITINVTGSALATVSVTLIVSTTPLPVTPDETGPALSLPTPHDWLTGIEAEWAVRTRIMGPETTIFSGLNRQALGGNASFFASNQRGAFEGLPGASSWRVDLSMKENRIVPDTLADLLLTFTLSGYYDAGLRKAVVDHAPRAPMASTAWFSAHRSFPDAYYQFNRTGKMEWNVTPDLLTLQGSLDRLQNVAVVCVPSQRRPELGRMMCSYPVEFVVDSSGATTILRNLPNGLSFTAHSLTLNATIPNGASVSFDFGDGSGLTESSTLPPPPHTYARPGRYEVLIRIAASNRLTEYRAVVVVSRQHSVLPPCVAVPDLPEHLTKLTGTTDKFTLQPSLKPTPESFSVSWRIDNLKPDPGSGPATFTLKPGRYVLRFSAVRPLNARFYSQQRHAPTASLALDSLHLATNRTFDVMTGNETTVSLNAFGQHVFDGGVTLSPTDRWTLELPLDDNPCLVSISSIDTRQHDLGELADAFLALEYKIKDE